MQTISQRSTRTTKVIETEADFASLQQHLKEIVEGAAFKGSHRSGQFLTYIVEQSISGHFDALKERIIGVNLFGRSPSYDTGEDAIVRVTASDVRKRLLQHYGKYGNTSEWRISLPSGSYIPEISREPQSIADLKNSIASHPEPNTEPKTPQLLAAAMPQVSDSVPQIVLRPEISKANDGAGTRWRLLTLLLVGLNLATWGIFWIHSSRSAVSPILPWSAFFRSQRPTQLIASDPNIAEIQGLTGAPLSLSDYANQQYIPNAASLSPQLISLCREILRGDKAAAVDTRIIASVAELAQAASNKINVHVARDIRLSNLYTDDNLILLGSPRSNPWSAVFNDQLDFRFAFDSRAQQEIIRNVHPRSGEPSSYVPTAKGWATGQSFATISFLQNPGKDGQVLLLAGANAEGTEAAGELVTNRQKLSAALRQCGISSASPVTHFQLLLRLNTMAGSPSNVDVVACHVLHGGSR
jgi:S-layer like family, C-terminal region